MSEAPKYTRDQVKRAIKKLFRGGDYDEIYDMVRVYGKEDYEKEPERVQLGILKLSNGNIEKLLEHVSMAKMNYRNIITKAEYAEDGGTYKHIDNPYEELL